MKTLSAALALLLTFHSPANALVATARLATAPRATFGLPPAVPALNAATLAVPLLPAQARFSVLSLQTLVPVAVPAMSPEPLHVARPESALAFPALRSAASAPDDASAQFDGGHVLPAGADASVPLSLPVKTFQLANGLTVVVHTDKSNPVVAVSITYKVGSEHEKPGLSGFAHLFEHLMAQGTKSLKPREISPLIESNGGIRNAYTMRSNTTYHSVVPKSALKTVLWAEAERMSTLNVDARALALEKQVVLEEMRLRVTNSAYARAYDAGMAETAFQRWGNQHTTIGEADDIRNARLEDVRAFYKAHYAPNNAVLALAGDVTEDEARALAQRFFGPLAPREIAPAPDLSEAPMTGETRRVIEDKFARVPRLMAAWRAPQRGSRDYWALTLLGEILGNSEDSPLFRSLVKDAKIALDAGMNIPWWTGPFNPSLGPDLFGLITHTKPGTTTDAVLSLVDTVMAELGAQGPAEGDLAAAKTKLELSWTKDLEQLIGRAQTLSSYAALVGDPANLPRDFAELMSVTASDVRSAIQRWIIGQGRAVVEARPTPDAVLPADVPAPPVPEQEPRAPGDPRPEIDPQRSAPAPALERFTLANGLKVVFARDARLPLLEARLSIPAGRIAERVGEEGLSVAVSELLLQGAEGRDARALSSAFAALGWKLDIDGLPQAVVVKAAGLSRNAGPFFKELAHVLARPAFPGEEVALWKENKVQEMRIRNSRPDFMASERLKAETLGSHPYGRPAVSDGQIAA
ncbi:MAG: insulinase family protein, partial [Elusimicrobia bacterium]|nr:insulinase family protein [Elusimicrobiota bacterium]